MPFEMDVQEIYEPPQHDPYGNRYHNHGYNNQVLDACITRFLIRTEGF